jgi:hypothetical protein
MHILIKAPTVSTLNSGSKMINSTCEVSLLVSFPTSFLEAGFFLPKQRTVLVRCSLQVVILECLYRGSSVVKDTGCPITNFGDDGKH